MPCLPTVEAPRGRTRGSSPAGPVPARTCPQSLRAPHARAEVRRDPPSRRRTDMARAEERLATLPVYLSGISFSPAHSTLLGATAVSTVSALSTARPASAANTALPLRNQPSTQVCPPACMALRVNCKRTSCRAAAMPGWGCILAPMRWPFALLAVSTAMAQPVLVRESGFKAVWEIWAPRAGIAPRGWLDATRYRARLASLALSGNSNPAVCGGWERTPAESKPDAGTVSRRTIVCEGPAGMTRGSAAAPGLARRGGQAGRPARLRAGGRSARRVERVTLEAPAPERAAAAASVAAVECTAGNRVVGRHHAARRCRARAAAGGVAALNFRPAANTSAGKQRRRRSSIRIGKRVPAGADVILLSEVITSTATGRAYQRRGRACARADHGAAGRSGARAKA